MPSVNHAVLGHTESAGAITDGTKLRVVSGSLVKYIDQPSQISRTLNATNTQSIGSAKFVFEFDAQVDYTPTSGWASTTTVATWFGFTTPTNLKWKFQQPEDTTIYNVFISNRGSVPQWLTSLRAETDSMAVFHFVLVQQ